MPKKARFGIAVLLVAIVAIAIAVSTWKSEPAKIRVGYLSITANLPLFVALENGYFEEDLNIEPVRFETSNQMIEALVANRIDVETAASSSVTVTVAQTLGDKIEIFMLNAFTPRDFLSSLLVKKGSQLDTIQDLDGKKVGTFPGSTMKTYTELLFAQAGATPSEVIQMAPATQLAALESGSIDALVTLEPLGTLGEEKGIAVRIETAPIETHLLNPWVAGTNSFSTQFLAAHPDGALRIRAALYKAVDFIRQNPETAKTAMINYTPVQDAAFASRLTIPLYWKLDEIKVEEFQRMADNLKEHGLLEQHVDVSKLLMAD